MDEKKEEYIYVSVPSYRLLNFELSLEKKETRLAEFNAEVSYKKIEYQNNSN